MTAGWPGTFRRKNNRLAVSVAPLVEGVAAGDHGVVHVFIGEFQARRVEDTSSS